MVSAAPAAAGQLRRNASGTSAAHALLAPNHARMNGAMEALHSLLPGTLRFLLRQGPLSQEKLEFAWRLAVGPAIDRATRVRLRGEAGVEVLVADAGWRKELRRSRAEILGKLRGLLGAEAVRDLRVTDDPARDD